MDDKLSSIQISKDGLAKLGMLASHFRRSKTQQLEWMIEHELASQEAMGVKFVVDLPAPAGVDPVSLVLTRKPQ